MSMQLRGPKPFAVVLCQFDDLPAPDISPQYILDFVARAGEGGLYDFWRDCSMGQVTLDGSDVFGWFPMQYGWGTHSGSLGRDAWINEAIRLATANGVNLAAYYGVMAVVNGSADDSASGSITTDLAIALTTPNQQYRWFYCRKCRAMAYDSAGGANPGPCVAGGVHDLANSNAYSLSIDDPRFPGQEGWRWCSKCRDLAYNGAGVTGPCAAGGTHDHSTSGNYRLGFGAVGFRGQDGWKWCLKCQALAYSGAGAGSCLAGGQHDHSTSFDYVIPYGGNSFSVEFVGHESGHTFGLHHSWSAKPDTEYGDRWDIMSAFNTDSATIGLYVPVGPRLNAATVHRMEWLPEDRVLTHVPGRGILYRGTQTIRVAALQRPDINLPLMIKVHTPERIYTVEFRQKRGWDRGMPQDAVLIHELRSYYCSSQKNWRWCFKCQGLHYAGYHVCAAGGLHDIGRSDDYRISIDDASGGGQDNWRWCRRCNVMAYAGSESWGPCAAGGLHDHANSGNYRLLTGGTGQDQWRYCHKCKGLTYSGLGALSACMGGGQHDPTNSFDYVLPHDTGGPGQNDWRYCRKCQGLVYSLRSACPAGGPHAWDPNSGYGLAYKFPAAGDDAWFWCYKCMGLASGTTAVSGVCPAGGAHERGTSFSYRLPLIWGTQEGQAGWQHCVRCQGLFYGPGAANSSCPAGGQHTAADSPNYVLANSSDDKSYLLGGLRTVGDVFQDDQGYIRISVDAIDGDSGIATITMNGYALIEPGPPGG